MPSRAVPLAWSSLTHDRVRFALFILGISFAVVLMGVQMGVRNALIDSNCRLIDHLAADLVLVHPHRAALFYREGVSRHRLNQAAVVPGVASVHPLYLDYQVTQLRSTANPRQGPREPVRSIRVIGVDPNAGLLTLPELQPGSPAAVALRTPGTALFDRRAKPSSKRRGETVYGPIPADPAGPWGVSTELNNRKLTLVGGFSFGTDFAADGTLLVSEQTFLDWVRVPLHPFSPDATVDLGLVRVTEGTDPAVTRDLLREALSASGSNRDVEVYALAEYRDRERLFWLTMTPIGFAFGAGMALGFAVGAVICYQILASDVSDHLAEYATLRAIGYSNGYLSGVVMRESLILAVAGFAPGMLVTAGVYAVLGATTGLPVNLTAARIGWVFLATVAMCVGSGLLALRKAQTVDPANVF